ncbi:Uncharacterised protein [uncultured archaeon]|nr:Uncharacterised protein [uncultured archaeon]
MVPVTPIRRLEKRMEAMEMTKSANNLEKFIEKVMDMVELNQKIIEDIVRSNQAMREDMSILVGKLDTLQTKVGGFVEIIQNAAESDVAQTAAETTGETIKPLIDQIESTSRQSQEMNTRMLQSLENIEKLLRRPQIPSSAVSSPAARDILARRGIGQPQS